MKAILPILGVMLITFSGCEESSHYIEPYCNDGIQNGNETGVDCGGDCIRCWECGYYCELVAGNIAAVPGYNLSDEPGFRKWNAFPPDKYIKSGLIWEDYYFYNTGKLMIIGLYNWTGEDDLDTTYGYWTFDDPKEPKAIGFSYSRAKPKSLDVYHYRKIFLLVPDSLIFEANYIDPSDRYFLLVKEE